MQLKTPQANSCRKSNVQYKTRRHWTAPCCSYRSSVGLQRVPPRTIKSLNVYCLSEIFQYVDFKDLIRFRSVCAFWKECVDFHLARRKHFVYGKQYNNNNNNKLPSSRIRDSGLQDDPGCDSFVTVRNHHHQGPLYACRKCSQISNQTDLTVTETEPAKLSNDSHHDHDHHDHLSDCSSSSLSVSRTSLSSDLSDSTTNDEYRLCYECGRAFPESEMIRLPPSSCSSSSSSSSSLSTFNDGQVDILYHHHHHQSSEQNIDVLNWNTLERILCRLPRLVSLKFAEGFRYGLKHNSLDVSGLNLMLRTHYHCPDLTSIDLSNCVGLQEADFDQLVKFYGTKLTWLNVSGCRMDENCLRILIKGCDRLKYLNMANNFCRLQGGCLEWISDRIETIVSDYNQNVRVLDGLLQGRGRNIIELELNVGYCFNPSMPYKILGTHFHNLISLRIIFKSFGKRKRGIFTHLANLTELECLYLIEEIDDFNSESCLDDESTLNILRSCGFRLRELHLHAACSLFNNSSSLTDQSISQIDTLCPLLEVLSLKRASITDQSLSSIAKLKNAYCVQLIDLEYISDQGIKQIMCSFRETENQHKENVKNNCGIDLNVGENAGPKVETKLNKRN